MLQQYIYIKLYNVAIINEKKKKNKTKQTKQTKHKTLCLKESEGK